MPYIPEREAAEWIGRTTETLRQWRHAGLPFTVQPRAGRMIRLYDTDDLTRYRDRAADLYRQKCGRPRRAAV